MLPCVTPVLLHRSPNISGEVERTFSVLTLRMDPKRQRASGELQAGWVMMNRNDKYEHLSDVYDPPPAWMNDQRQARKRFKYRRKGVDRELELEDIADDE